MSKERDKRVVQLVAREGMLSDMLEEGLHLDEGEFKNDNFRKIIALIHKETLEEMSSLGLKPLYE